MTDKILRTIFSIVVLPFFALTFVFAFIGYFLVFNLSAREKAIHRAHVVSYWWAKVAFITLLIRIKIKGKELIDRKTVYVFVSNHRSLLDVPAWVLSTFNSSKFLSKEEINKLPVFGYVLKRLYITVKRSDKNDRAKSIQKMREALNENVSVYLAPEGTRNKKQEVILQPFHDGAFRLAIEAQVPIGVFTLYNTDNLLSPKTLFGLKPGIIYGQWQKPVETTGLTDKDIPELKQRVWQMMRDNYLELEKCYKK